MRSLTSTPSEEAAEAEAVEEGEMSESMVRKRKRARPKNPIAMRNSNAMNQLCCQNGTSDSEGFLDSLYTIRVDPDCGCEEEEGFLRDRLCDPEEATVRPDLLSRSEQIIKHSTNIECVDACLSCAL